MKSYVISVSLGTGCYRHIKISASATLYRLHKVIIAAFDFDDDHAHAFFMDNKYWSRYAAFYSMKMHGDERLTKSYKLQRLGLSKGDQFKYLFDFGEEWRVQCRVLRELDEEVDIPCVIRSVGESPEQYPEPVWDNDEWEEAWDEDTEDCDGIEILPPDVICSLFSSLPIPMETVQCIHRYFEAAARLYGVIPVKRLLEIYNGQNETVEQDVFLVLTEVIRHEQNRFYVLGKDDLYDNAAPSEPIEWEIIDEYLLQDGVEDYRELLRLQKDKPYRILKKEEFLRYADQDYYPETKQNTAMLRFLVDRGNLRWPRDTWMGIQTMIEMDFSLSEILECAAEEGLVFDKTEDLEEFAALFQELNIHTRKQANRGHTPAELFTVPFTGNRFTNKQPPVGQISLFNEMSTNLISFQPPSKKPSRNSPCPCGSGKKYKRCCGKSE